MQVTSTTDLLSWCSLACVRLTPWEVDTLGDMEQARLQEARTDREDRPTGDEIPVTNSAGVKALITRLAPGVRRRTEPRKPRKKS